MLLLPAVRLPLCLGAPKVGQPAGPIPVPYPAVWVQKSDLDADRVQPITGTLGGAAEPLRDLPWDQVFREAAVAQLPDSFPPAASDLRRPAQVPALRFYFRFFAPFRDELTYRPERVLPLIREGLRPFVGLTAFEELSRQWIAEQSRAGRLPFEPQDVGSHWSHRVQVDVVAVNWQERAVMLGECKWGTDRVRRDVIRNLLEEKTVRLLRDLTEASGEGWTVHYAFFARVGFADAARSLAQDHGVLSVDLDRLDRDLQTAGGVR